MSMPLPALGGNVLHRARLSQMLDDAMKDDAANGDATNSTATNSDAPNRPVILLTAPAGWGKTSALRAWLDHRATTGPVAWLSLRSASGDPRALASSLIAENEPDPLLVLDDVPDGD